MTLPTAVRYVPQSVRNPAQGKFRVYTFSYMTHFGHLHTSEYKMGSYNAN